ncbi:MAG: T9SS type A sorting domain-containing protein [Flavobacteriales bacterium]|nr:T9SS type A sorting domain-containing protein [Flavobacteriales bacterium]
MKRFFTKFQVAAALILIGFSANAQFSKNDVKYWVGSGPDTAILVVDFIDTTVVAGGFDTIPSSYAWGFLFDSLDNITAANMLSAIDLDDSNLDISASAFLNDIVYDIQSGIAATPNYWGTWTKTEATTWAANGGIGDTLFDGMWFGCSYTDFSPAISPQEPVAAKNSNLFTTDDVSYWIGSGADTAYLVVDFLAQYSLNSFTWGYLYNNSATMEQMLGDIATADINLTVNINNGFINDINYGNHQGLGGLPNYWGTWQGSNLSTLHSNSGISEMLINGNWYACSYTDFSPAIMPEATSQAIPAGLFSFSDVKFWIGTGEDSAIFVVDFLANGSSYAWGYLFSDSTSGDSMLFNIATLDSDLSYASASGFLNDITYDTESGIGGNPNYWGTWSATNTGDWYSNIGLSTVVKNGDWFGCSYTDFVPALRPSVPAAVSNPNTGIEKLSYDSSIFLYPNPTNGAVYFSENANRIEIYSLTGQLLHVYLSTNQIDLSELIPSVYLVKVKTVDSVEILKIMKQ